jgi:hypothetical protein
MAATTDQAGTTNESHVLHRYTEIPWTTWVYVHVERFNRLEKNQSRGLLPNRTASAICEKDLEQPMLPFC